MAINIDKTKEVHFRNECVNRTMYKFSLGNCTLETVSQYKYLGFLFDENLTFELNASLADAAGRALVAIISKLKYLKECRFKSFSTLFESGVLSISD